MSDVASKTPTGLLPDAALVAKILSLLDDGATDLSELTWQEPVAHYMSADRLESEIERVLRRLPVAFCPSAALPSAGSYLARDAGGIPIVALRDSNGDVRAFRNACRHRGTALVSGRGCEKSLVCPYHGWVYRLDGRLRHVPHEYGFPGIDKASRGLVSVEATEQGGIVFIAQDPDVDRQPTSETCIPDLIGSDQELFASTEGVVAANWKVLVEGFLEGYHIKATHGGTFLPFGYDNVTVVETFGRHSRVTFPFRRIEALKSAPASDWHLDGLVTSVHHLFPNVIVARLSHHTTMVVLEPCSTDTTNLVTYQLTNRITDGRKSDEASRDTNFVSQGAVEDLTMALAVQRGLTSGANDALEFGRFEGAITHFHRQLTELVDGVATDGSQGAMHAR